MTAYELFQQGLALLESKDFMQASVPLEKAKELEPEKSSIREALGRAYFHAGRYEQAAGEFSAIVDCYPTNDYAHFCLGRSMQKLGRNSAARRHISIASHMRPDRVDYRVYCDRLDSRG